MGVFLMENLPGQVKRSSAYVNVFVKMCQFTDVLLKVVPRVSIKAFSNLRRHVRQHKSLVTVLLAYPVVSGCSHMTSVKTTAFVVGIG